jgi:hypothetical protein
MTHNGQRGTYWEKKEEYKLAMYEAKRDVNFHTIGNGAIGTEPPSPEDSQTGWYAY